MGQGVPNRRAVPSSEPGEKEQVGPRRIAVETAVVFQKVGTAARTLDLGDGLAGAQARLAGAFHVHAAARLPRLRADERFDGGVFGGEGL